MTRYLFLLLIFISTLPYSAELNDLRFITEEYPPYNYTHNGQVTGISVDILKSASTSVHDTVKKVEVQPWARGYRNATIGPLVVLFSTTRTHEREAKFKWAGPIISTEIVVLAKKSKQLKVSNPDELKKYTIGVVRSDVGEQLLSSLGVQGNKIVPTHDPEILIKKLAHNRVDMIAYDANVTKNLMKKQKIDFNQYEIIYLLSKAELYFAFSLDTPNIYVHKLQTGIDNIRNNGQLDEIKQNY
ncbi:ABC transporter substrate-binding protein [Vibrio sp. S4M6]|uniref:substrate-binding periplasmic protein n=1 Tax=Vibrio sinus TaxID=2946865 RepID=UPI00202A8B5D|nr:transporter substrate-binding domain-containing protein [Vibrio sinus]MCL9781204.1 ABC transporter substrate-binding protein [Vibrio sinus]